MLLSIESLPVVTESASRPAVAATHPPRGTDAAADEFDPLEVLLSSVPLDDSATEESRDTEVHALEQLDGLEGPSAPRPEESAEFATIGSAEGSRLDVTAQPLAGSATVERNAADQGRQTSSGFIEVKCPVCQDPGLMSLDRSHRQMSCRVCGTSFYLDRATNELVVGLLPDAIRGGRADGPKDPGKLQPLLGEVTLKRWKGKLEQRRGLLRTGMVAAAVFAVGWYGIGHFTPRPALNNQVLDRAYFVARAINKNEPSQVQAIAEPSTRGDARRWFRKVRPEDWPDSGIEPQLRAQMHYCRPKSKEACITVEIVRGRADDRPIKPDPGNQGLKLTMYWVLSDGEWLLDGTTTLSRLK